MSKKVPVYVFAHDVTIGVIASGPIQCGHPDRPTWIHQIQLRDPEYRERVWTVFTGTEIECRRVYDILSSSHPSRKQAITAAVLRREARRRAARADNLQREASYRREIK